MSLQSLNDFLAWFTSHDGQYDPEFVGFADSEGLGRSTIALKDIEEGMAIFTFPPSLSLSTKTCKLRGLFGEEQWRHFGLHRGWVGLILCLLWETAKGTESKWYPYLKSLPTEFQTPMFWTEDELKELEGTSIAVKIGKEDVEKDFRESLLPAVKSRPDIFRVEHLETIYTVKNYHIMGSRILSRSFHDGGWSYDNPEEDEVGIVSNEMDVDQDEGDEAPELIDQGNEEEGEDSSDDDDSETEEDTAMVPFADLLNARCGCSNAKLEYDDEATSLAMVCTKPIKKGEEIWNTYGDPPNSDLLRRYGHVDLVDLGNGEFGNPADVVELRADIVLEVSGISKESVQDRLDWWLDGGHDDIFVLDYSLDVPKDLISFTRLVQLDNAEWVKVQEEGKPPKSKPDDTVLVVIQKAIERRLAEYKTSLEDDRSRLASLTGNPSSLLYSSPSYRLQCALVVRIGEKTILTRILKRIAESLASSTNSTPPESHKRSRESGGGSHHAKKPRK